MHSEIEIKTIVHFDDGYKGNIEIGDNPDAPEISTKITLVAEKNVIADFTISDELIPNFIKALKKYYDMKKGETKCL